jgi:peptidoglycan/LPS O-acetylase OafA/YrhL
VTAYDPTEWHDLFVAVAGASAALAGLVFVAVSINIERILRYPGLPERALETLLFLVLVLLISIVGLIPGQSHVALGLELIVVVFGIAAVVFRLKTVQVQEGEESRRAWKISRWTVRLAAIVPLAIGGLSLLTESGGGLYWIVAGIVFAISGAVASAWVLLVEILR